MAKAPAPDQEWRQLRLRQLVDRPDVGGRAALGRALGYKDGAFVGQMLSGVRPITEKTVTAVQALHGGKFKGWFDRVSDDITEEVRMAMADTVAAVDQTLSSIESQVRAALKDERLVQLLIDLEDIPLPMRSKLLDTIHQHAESAREAHEHFERKKKTMAAHGPRGRAQRSIAIRLGDGNPDQGSLELRIADDPFTAQPDERELQLYQRFAKHRAPRL